jgi:hypothetical protein
MHLVFEHMRFFSVSLDELGHKNDILAIKMTFPAVIASEQSDFDAPGDLHV